MKIRLRTILLSHYSRYWFSLIPFHLIVIYLSSLYFFISFITFCSLSLLVSSHNFFFYFHFYLLLLFFSILSLCYHFAFPILSHFLFSPAVSYSKSVDISTLTSFYICFHCFSDYSVPSHPPSSHIYQNQLTPHSLSFTFFLFYFFSSITLLKSFE